MARALIAFIFLSLAGFLPAQARPVPRPDHVVIVIEENRAYSQIIGNRREAPFINFLARRGALFTRSYAVAHPSQPNYLALFSGSTQGTIDDACPPPGSPFQTPNLADELRAGGYAFAAYAEDLPYPGYTGCGFKLYARKHAPWADWAGAAKLAFPFSSFPSDYRRLPAVSFVIPNLVNDMHDDGIAAGDRWLKKKLSAYIQWAETHNSLFILTFDEDDNTPVNRVPTLFIGENVRPGKYAGKITHYSVLATLESMFELRKIGRANAAPITGIWKERRY